MKTTQVTSRNRVQTNSQPRRRNKRRFDPAEVSFAPVAPAQNLIQWPTPQEIQEVSRRLGHINQMGIRWEAKGDYFNSGDLAYQLQEIIRATEDLFRKTQRLKR